MKELTKIQLEMLKQMLEWDYEYSYPYSEFNDIADKKVLKKEMRGLVAGGYVEISRGGINDDGEMYGGTGFSLNYERIGEVRKLVEEMAETIDIWEVDLSGLIYDMVNHRSNKVAGFVPTYKDITNYVRSLMKHRSEVTCGDANPTGNVALTYKGGCMKKIDIHDAYRCTGCGGCFHKDCILKHFELEKKHDYGRNEERKQIRARIKKVIDGYQDTYFGSEIINKIMKAI